MNEMIQVRAPRFVQYQSVELHWNGQATKTKVVRRWLDADDGDNGYWWYEVAAIERKLYPESALELAAE